MLPPNLLRGTLLRLSVLLLLHRICISFNVLRRCIDLRSSNRRGGDRCTIHFDRSTNDVGMRQLCGGLFNLDFFRRIDGRRGLIIGSDRIFSGSGIFTSECALSVNRLL